MSTVLDDDDFSDLDEWIIDDHPVKADPDNELIDLDSEDDEPMTDEQVAWVRAQRQPAIMAPAREPGWEAVEPEPALVSRNTEAEEIRRPLISGHCAFPGQDKKASHRRCAGFSRANPGKIFQPCPCSCHFPEERYECGGCGATIAEAPHYPLDEDGDTRYVHVDPKTERMVDEECPR